MKNSNFTPLKEEFMKKNHNDLKETKQMYQRLKKVSIDHLTNKATNSKIFRELKRKYCTVCCDFGNNKIWWICREEYAF